MMIETLVIGREYSAERTFTRAMVDAFTDLSQDRAPRHVTPDEGGRVLVHGLLVASLATEIGGRFNVLARNMDFEFLRPVYAGDKVRCIAKFEALEQPDGRTRLSLTGGCTNQDGVEVMRFVAVGVLKRT